MELLAKAYLLFSTLILTAVAFNNSSEQEPKIHAWALLSTALMVVAVLVVW